MPTLTCDDTAPAPTNKINAKCQAPTRVSDAGKTTPTASCVGDAESSDGDLADATTLTDLRTTTRQSTKPATTSSSTSRTVVTTTARTAAEGRTSHRAEQPAVRAQDGRGGHESSVPGRHLLPVSAEP